MSIAKSLACVVALHLSFVCADAARAQTSADPTGTETGYGSPGYWKGRGTAYFNDLKGSSEGLCKIGEGQSPVALPPGDAAQLPEIIFNYAPLAEYKSGANPGNFAYTNNGHTAELVFDPDEYQNKPGENNIYAKANPADRANFGMTAADERGIRIGDKNYKLLQMHFHHPSEHLLDGRRFHMEAHFVHRGPPPENHLVVVAVLLDAGPEGPTTNDYYRPFLTWPEANLPNKDDVLSMSKIWGRIYALLPPPGPNGRRDYRRYDGSLTTPNCNENVSWIVLNTPVPIREEDVQRFVGVFGVNARPLQPLNSRIVVRPE